MSNYDCELDLTSRNSLSVLIDRIKQNSIVLEFGPANGRMTKYLKEKLNCKVYCVEIDADSANDASEYAEKMFVGSIENYKWKQEFKTMKFDYIIFADVLEHLYHPEKALKSVREFLKKDGSILISIPNIAHNAIILGLLKNEFNYSSRGLLDDTHIRFFTKKTFDKLIERCKYFKAYETGIFLSPQNTEFGYQYNDLPEHVASYLSGLSNGEIYQLVYELKSHAVEVLNDFKNKYKIQLGNTNTELWKRVNQAESELEESNRTNTELWKRVNQAESELEESNRTNAELWKRVNKVESELEEINHMTLIKYIKRYFQND